jgi:hypothetical protein
MRNRRNHQRRNTLSELPRDRILGSHPSRRAIVPSEELPDVQEGHDQEIECIEANRLDWEPSVAIRGVAALDLNPDLGGFTGMGDVRRVGMDADQVIAFVVRRGFVGEDVPPDQVPHDEELGTSGDDGESEKVLLHRSIYSVAGRSGSLLIARFNRHGQAAQSTCIGTASRARFRSKARGRSKRMFFNVGAPRVDGGRRYQFS